jgi:hypothetical protein
MKITTIIDFEDGEDFVACLEKKIDDQLFTHRPHECCRYIGDSIGSLIDGYLLAKISWEQKLEIEKIILIEHDRKTNYQGGAPAGKPEIAWGFRKISNEAGRVVVPVFRPDPTIPRVINEWGGAVESAI